MKEYALPTFSVEAHFLISNSISTKSSECNKRKNIEGTISVFPA